YYAAGYWGTNPRDAWPRTYELATKALAIDPEAGEARIVLAQHAASVRFAWDDALRECELAAAQEPGNPVVHGQRAYVLIMCGRSEDAVAAARLAYELDPLAPTLQLEGFVHWVGRRFDEANALLESIE